MLYPWLISISRDYKAAAKIQKSKTNLIVCFALFLYYKKYFKGSDNMIYKPQNVYPHNTAIDASEDNSFSFIFNGDHLKGYDFVFYDALLIQAIINSFWTSW